MTGREAISLYNLRRPNSHYPSSQLEEWLDELEKRIALEVTNTHVGVPETEEGELTAGSPYCEVYPLYLAAQADFHNGETDKYAVSSAMFNAAYQAFYDYINRKYMPVRRDIHFGF